MDYAREQHDRKRRDHTPRGVEGRSQQRISRHGVSGASYAYGIHASHSSSAPVVPRSAWGAVAGQILGGVLVSADLLGGQWRSIFFVNVPVGLAVIAAGARYLSLASDGAATHAFAVVTAAFAVVTAAFAVVTAAFAVVTAAFAGLAVLAVLAALLAHGATRSLAVT
jgi:MFS family permease